MKKLKMMIFVFAGLFSRGTFLYAQAQKNSRGKVLVVLTTAKTLQLQNGKIYNSPGYYLDELTYPLLELVESGYEPVFTSIGGQSAHYDPFSENKLFFDNDVMEVSKAKALLKKFENELKNPERLQDLTEKVSDFKGVLIPGGFGPMVDLVTDKDLGKILTYFHFQKKPTGLICHGPVALLSTLKQSEAFKSAMVSGDYQLASTLAKDWIYNGYRLTVFSSAEELMLHQLDGKVTYLVSHALAQAGAHVDYLGQIQSNVIVDRELVTGQQPFSAKEFAQVFVKRLNDSAEKI